MKLMKKSEVNTQSAELKRQQISEGQELIKRIEALRAALSSLQQQHKDFLEKSQEELHRETTELFGQRESLKAEVASLTIVQAELQKPLIDRWNELKQAEVRFNTDRERLLIDKLQFTEKEDALAAMRKVLEGSLERAKVMEYEAKKRNEDSLKKDSEAEKTLVEARKQEESTNTKVTKALKDIDVQRKGMEFERQGLEHVKSLQRVKELELNEREAEIKSKYQMLLKVKNVKRK